MPLLCGASSRAQTKLENNASRESRIPVFPRTPAVKDAIVIREPNPTSGRVDKEGERLTQGYATLSEWRPIRLIEVRVTLRVLLIPGLELELGAGDEAAVVRVERYADSFALRKERPTALRRFPDLANDRIESLELDLLSHPVTDQDGDSLFALCRNRGRWLYRLRLWWLDLNMSWAF